MKRLNLLIFILAMTISCEQNKRKNDDFDLLRKYFNIHFPVTPAFVDQKTDCVDFDCNVVHIYQLDKNQESVFVDHVENDSTHWKNNGKSGDYRSSLIEISKTKFLFVEYLSDNNLLFITRGEI